MADAALRIGSVYKLAKKSDRDPFTQAMINLRAHMVACYTCRYVSTETETESFCPQGVRVAIQVAKAADKLLAAKRHAVSTINDYVYACPDIAIHGEAYALTARPLAVTAVQEELF